MLTPSQLREIVSACERLSSQGHLLEKNRDASNERGILLLIGDTASTLSRVVEQQLAPWNQVKK